MKNYIEKNICKYKIAKTSSNKFGIMYYKLKNNFVFGKQMKNVRKYMKVEILQIKKNKKLRHLASFSLFVSFKVFDNKITAVYMLKNTVTLNKPVYIGQVILNISKA